MNIIELNSVYDDSHEFSELYEMARCGVIPNESLYLIIWTNDQGWIPHVHITDNPNMNKATFKCALKLETPEYFIHGPHIDVLNTRQIKRLIKFLKSEKFPGITNYRYLITVWNDNNSDALLPNDLDMPDYNLLKILTINNLYESDS